MRASQLTALLAVTLLTLAGCGGGNKVELDKTISHKEGILNVGQVVSVSPKLEARAGAGDWQDLSKASNRELENWMQDKTSAEARSYIQFDTAQLPLESKTVNNAGQLKDMKSKLDNRMGDVDSFMKNNNKQLDARGW